VGTSLCSGNQLGTSLGTSRGTSRKSLILYVGGEPCFYAFDLLWLNGKDLRGLPLVDRKKTLRKLIPRGSRLLYVDHVIGRGEDLFRLACARDLEGVVAKWKRGRYMEGERTSWIKIKNRRYTQSIGREKLFVVKRAG
jgi:ATP-dependent DNA ligase